MVKNVGSIDRNIRIAIAVILFIVAFAVPMGMTAQIIVIVAAVIALTTGAINFCPLYRLIGVNTCKVDN